MQIALNFVTLFVKALFEWKQTNTEGAAFCACLLSGLEKTRTSSYWTCFTCITCSLLLANAPQRVQCRDTLWRWRCLCAHTAQHTQDPVLCSPASCDPAGISAECQQPLWGFSGGRWPLGTLCICIHSRCWSLEEKCTEKVYGSCMLLKEQGLERRGVHNEHLLVLLSLFPWPACP